MTSPISLLSALGAAEPVVPTPPPEDPGLFTAVLTAALQAGMLPPPPPAMPVTVALQEPPVPEDAEAAMAESGAPSAEPVEAGSPAAEPATQPSDGTAPEPVARATEGGAGAPVTGEPAAAHPLPARGTGESPVREPKARTTRRAVPAPGTPPEGEPARPMLSASARAARATARALALLEGELPSPRMAGEIARGPRPGSATAVPLSAAPSEGGNLIAPMPVADQGSQVVPMPVAVQGEQSGGAAPAAAHAAPDAAAGESPALAAPIRGEASTKPRSGEKAAHRRAGIAPEGPRAATGARQAPDGFMPAARAVPRVPAAPAAGPAEPLAPPPTPLAAAWNTGRRAAQPDPVRAAQPSRDVQPDAAALVPEENEDRGEPTSPTPVGSEHRPLPIDMMAQAPRPVVTSPAPLPRGDGTGTVVGEDEAEALIARARRNLAASAPLAIAPEQVPARWATPAARRDPRADSSDTTAAEVRRAVPTVPAVEALMQALGRALEGAEVTAVRVTLGQDGRAASRTPAIAAPAADSTSEDPAMPGASEPTLEDGAGPPTVRTHRPVERLGRPEPRRGAEPMADRAIDDDRAAAPVDRLAVERAPARPGRAELTAFEPTGRALREAVAARPARVPAPDLPSDRQELPVGSRGEAPRAARREPEEHMEAPAPSDAGARGSAGAADGRAREARPTDGADRAAPREAHELREAWVDRGRPAGAADRVTLQVADSDGRQTRIRVSVLGEQVRATILPPDSTSARQLEQRMDELQAALVRQGFTDAKVSVQAGRGEGALPWGASQAVAPNETRSSSGTDQPPGDQRQGTGRRDGERQGDGQRHPHQRPRERDPNDRRRQ